MSVPRVFGIRLVGPYQQNGGWRYKIVSSSGKHWAPMAQTKQQALKRAEKIAQNAARQGTITIRQAIEAHVKDKRGAGARPQTLEGTKNGLAAYFAGMLDTPLGKLTARACQRQYDQMRLELNARTGKVPSVSTHRVRLGQAKNFARWVRAKGWLREDPTIGIKGVGKKRRGKVQLSLDEARLLSATCVAEARRGDLGALATLACMLMAMRSSEVISRVVRDLDDEGKIIRINDNESVGFQTKNDSSKRPVRVPKMLQPLIAAAVAGKAPSDPIFPGTIAGRRSRQWLHTEVKRLCTLASVQIVGPHALRGTMATAAAAAGELPEVVAKVLGHTDQSMTLAHYIKPGVSEAAQLERGVAAFTHTDTSLPFGP